MMPNISDLGRFFCPPDELFDKALDQVTGLRFVRHIGDEITPDISRRNGSYRSDDDRASAGRASVRPAL
jgi:hypothetical protein